MRRRELLRRNDTETEHHIELASKPAQPEKMPNLAFVIRDGGTSVAWEHLLNKWHDDTESVSRQDLFMAYLGEWTQRIDLKGWGLLGRTRMGRPVLIVDFVEDPSIGLSSCLVQQCYQEAYGKTGHFLAGSIIDPFDNQTIIDKLNEAAVVQD